VAGSANSCENPKKPNFTFARCEDFKGVPQLTKKCNIADGSQCTAEDLACEEKANKLDAADRATPLQECATQRETCDKQARLTACNMYNQTEEAKQKCTLANNNTQSPNLPLAIASLIEEYKTVLGLRANAKTIKTSKNPNQKPAQDELEKCSDVPDCEQKCVALQNVKWTPDSTAKYCQDKFEQIDVKTKKPKDPQDRLFQTLRSECVVRCTDDKQECLELDSILPATCTVKGCESKAFGSLVDSAVLACDSLDNCKKELNRVKNQKAAAAAAAAEKKAAAAAAAAAKKAAAEAKKAAKP
jgi:hypothetical protein